VEERSLLKQLVRSRSLENLRVRIEAIERHRVDCTPSCIVTGWGPPMESLTCGVLHEWFAPRVHRGQTWTAPILLFAHLARQTMRDVEADGTPGAATRTGTWIVWIGRRVWPQPHALIAPTNNRIALTRSLLVDPASASDRLWAIDLCLRSPAVAVVIADASGLKLSQTRRLQLAAESGCPLALLARPAQDIVIPSAAATRWSVERIVSPTRRPRWRLELVRCKGVQRRSGMEAHAAIVLEHHRATGCIRIPAHMADRPTQTAAPHATTVMQRAG
jgi:hypothetical protein